MMYYQPQKNLLENKKILITGAGDGIGKEAALTYANYGADVLLVGRTESKLQTIQQVVLQDSGKFCSYYVFDFLHMTVESATAVANWVSQHTSSLDGVLHNAGILGDIAPFIKQTPAAWNDVMQINVNATFLLTQSLLPLLLKSPSASLIFTSSGVGKTGRANWGAYSVSKFATEGMMQILADEYKQTALRVNCINPGRTRTQMRAAAAPGEDPMTLKTPAEIMPLYLYLMGDDSRRKNGESFDAQPQKTSPSA